MTVSIKEIAGKLQRIGSLHAVGDVWFGLNEYVPVGVLLCNGGIYAKETFKDLWQWAVNTRQTKSSSDYESLKSRNGGQCPYFCDLNSSQFKMPVLSAYPMFGAPTASSFYKQAGLPNIKGNLVISKDCYVGYSSSSGAFSTSNSLQTGWTSGAESKNNKNELDFNAANSNSIYGRSSTVTPETNIIQVGIYAYGAILPTGTASLEATAATLRKASEAVTEGTNTLKQIISSNQLVLKSGNRGVLAGYETVTPPSDFMAEVRIDINSNDTTILGCVSQQKLTFAPASEEKCAVKVIYLKAGGQTALSIQGARWAGGEPPEWGKPNSVLVIAAHFISGEVILGVFDNHNPS